MEVIETDVVVVGAGLSGLAAAELIRRRGARVVVVDGQAPGGRGRTDVVDGFRFNRGAHALYLDGHAKVAARRARRADTWRSAVDAGVRPARRPRRPSACGCTHDADLGPARVARPDRRDPGAAGRSATGEPSTLAGVSVAEWVDGMHLTADAADLVLALIRVSSYGHAPDVMSADLAAAQIQMALGGGVRYLDGGWQTMVDALAARLDVRRLQAVARAGRRRAGGRDDRGRPGDHRRHGRGRGRHPARPRPDCSAGRPFECGPPIEASCLDLGVRRAAPRPFLLGVDRPLYLSTHHPPAQLAPPGTRWSR